MPVKVYHAPNSRSLRVLWALEEMAIPYEVETLPFPPRVHRPDFVKLNPVGTLPAIVDGDLVLSESMAICQYLSARHGGGALAVSPDDAEYAEYLRWLWYGESTLAPPVGTMARIRRLGAAAEGAGAVVEDARNSFAARGAALEQRLDGREFVVGGRFTLADISCAYAPHLASVFGAGELVAPRSAAWLERMRARPAFVRAAAVL